MLPDAFFTQVDTDDQALIRSRFEPFVTGQLHPLLNGLHSLQGIQAIRGGRANDAFGTFATGEREWYTFNHGGRNECQFNVGLGPSYLRIGLGFEFSHRKHGDPDAVLFAYLRFRKHITARQAEFRALIEELSLEVECTETGPGDDITNWILNDPMDPQPRWIFVGRCLYREGDGEVLRDEVALAKVIDKTFAGLRPYWQASRG